MGLSLVCAILFVAIAVLARGAQATDLAVLPPRAPAELEVLARGATEWTRARFAEAGLPSSDAFSLAAALPTDRPRALPPRATLGELGRQSGAERAWVLDLAADRGQATVQVVVVDLASESAVAAGHVEASIAMLGDAVAKAADAVIAQCGAAGRTVGTPSVAELDRYGRAAIAADGGQLADAWRALGKKITPASQMLRKRLETSGQSEQVPIGERTRLAVARGDSERARLWLRSEIAHNQDDALLALAAAEAAEELGETERAIPLYDRAIELAPGSEPARAGRVRVLLQAGRSAEGLEARP